MVIRRIEDQRKKKKRDEEGKREDGTLGEEW